MMQEAGSWDRVESRESGGPLRRGIGTGCGECRGRGMLDMKFSQRDRRRPIALVGSLILSGMDGREAKPERGIAGTRRRSGCRVEKSAIAKTRAAWSS